MEKLLKKCLFAVMAIFIVTSFTSCNNDEPDFNSTDDVAGLYVGQLNAVGASSEVAEVAYVTLTKKSSSTVSCKIESEGWGIDAETVNLNCTFSGNVASLESETSKAIRGQAYNGNLQLTFMMSDLVFQFTGTKD
jgi:hypothetical protein